MAWDRNIHWRQGNILPIEVAQSLGLVHHQVPECTRVIVGTHDCDLAHDPDSEPNIEVFVGKYIDKENGNFTSAKNPRKLHIFFEGNSPQWIEFEAVTKQILSKQNLISISPNPSDEYVLDPQNREIFQKWLSIRYRRSAFPEEFDKRMSTNGLDRAIQKLIEPTGEHLVGIFFDVDNGYEVHRIDDEDTYTLNIILIHSATPDFSKAEEIVENLACEINKSFKNAFFNEQGKWVKIELKSCDFFSESVITYEIFKSLKPWRFEHLSLRAEPQQEILPE